MCANTSFASGADNRSCSTDYKLQISFNYILQRDSRNPTHPNNCLRHSLPAAVALRRSLKEVGPARANLPGLAKDKRAGAKHGEADFSHLRMLHQGSLGEFGVMVLSLANYWLLNANQR